jgi:glycosyltransferase involved in cell wall biosynthesis
MGNVVYVSKFITEDIKEKYDISSVSQAGFHKISNIARSIRDNNKKVTIVSPILSGNPNFTHLEPDCFDYEEENIKIFTPRSFNLYDITVINQVMLALFTTTLIMRLVIRKDTEFILLYNFAPARAIPAITASVFGRLPLILEYEDGSFANSSGIMNIVYRLLSTVSKPYINGAVCVNHILAERAPTKNTIVFRGIPSVGLPKSLPNGNYDKPEAIIMYAGKFDRVRGVHKFIDVADEHNRDGCKYWISGWGAEDDVNKIRERINRLDNDKIRYFGELPFNEYRMRCVQADVLVNPQNPHHTLSKYTFPSKILDFLSSGSVVITTDMADLRSEMSDVVMISEYSTNSLAKKIDKVLAMNDKEMEKIKVKGQEWIIHHCDRERVGSKIIDLAG